MKDSTLKKYKQIIDEWLHNGENGTKAYQMFFPNSTDKTAATNFIKILRITEVKEHEQKQRGVMADKIKEEHGVTLETQMQDQIYVKSVYHQLLDLALKSNLDPLEEAKFNRLKSVISTSDFNKINDTINKMLGLNAPVKIENTNIELSDEDIKRKIIKLKAMKDDITKNRK